MDLSIKIILHKVREIILLKQRREEVCIEKQQAICKRIKKRDVLNAKPGMNRALLYRWINKYGNSIPHTILKIYSFNMKYFFTILFTFQKKM
jgi:hypothetical protein